MTTEPKSKHSKSGQEAVKVEADVTRSFTAYDTATQRLIELRKFENFTGLVLIHPYFKLDKSQALAISNTITETQSLNRV